jgi:hypothetical protein
MRVSGPRLCGATRHSEYGPKSSYEINNTGTIHTHSATAFYIIDFHAMFPIQWRADNFQQKLGKKFHSFLNNAYPEYYLVPGLFISCKIILKVL